MKHVLFSVGDDVAIMGKSTRRMMMHLSVYVGDEIQLYPFLRRYVVSPIQSVNL